MILGFHCHDLGSIPGWGTEMLQVMLVQPKKKKNILQQVDLRWIASCKAGKLEPLRPICWQKSRITLDFSYIWAHYLVLGEAQGWVGIHSHLCPDPYSTDCIALFFSLPK